MHLILLASHLPCIPSILLKIRSEFDILCRDRILADIWQKEERQKGTENAKAATNKERILTASNTSGTAWGIVLDDGEEVGSDKSTNFSHGRGNRVVLATNGCGAGLGSDKADVVAWSRLSEGKEDTIDDDKAGNVGTCVKLGVASGHNEAHNSLGKDESTKGKTGTHPIT